MRRVAAIASLLFLSLQQAACGPSLPKTMREAQAAASRAYSAGRYEEAAEHYREAAKASERTRDRDEMLYLQASASLRANRQQEARKVFEELVRQSPKGERGARAAFEIAQLEIRHGSSTRGYGMLLQFIYDYPDSGVTRPALDRYLDWLDDTQGPSATLSFLRQNEKKLDLARLGEEAVYAQARRLEQLGETVNARDTYIRCATSYPYPSGGLFDDALFRASELDEKLGDPKLAIAHLKQQLREREKATLNASYERPRYATAQLRIARLYRDALKEPDLAKREYRRLYSDFKTSLLRDDALWEEALLASETGDKDGACEAAKLLARDFAESRYRPCLAQLCAEITPTQRQCRHYIQRQSP